MKLALPTSLFSSNYFRATVYFSCFLVVVIGGLFLFTFWEVSVFEIKRVDHQLERDGEILSRLPSGEVAGSVSRRVAADFHRILYSALFDAAGRPMVGNLSRVPDNLKLDGRAHRANTDLLEIVPLSRQIGRLVGRRLEDGRILVIGRNVDSLEDLQAAELRAMEIGVAPALLISLLGGALLGSREKKQIEAIHRAAERIASGRLGERLPIPTKDENLTKLASSVNLMLDEVVQSLEHMRSSGDHIAHDLRTPLTQVRSYLDRAREIGGHDNNLLDQAVAGLDRALRTIAALRRVSELEVHDRCAAFRSFSLASVIAEVVEFYGPLADDRQILLTSDVTDLPNLIGDHDLLLEAASNLLDNALKFTPRGGHVRIGLSSETGEIVFFVEDNGPGIPAEDREAVLKRHYRTARTRHVQGTGLGLSIVQAIVRLHGYRLVIADIALGCRIEIRCPLSET
jgi:signal transduction histidine kinase